MEKINVIGIKKNLCAIYISMIGNYNQNDVYAKGIAMTYMRIFLDT